MRFAFLTELYTPSVGGQEVFFQELGEAMVRRGHSVDVYCIGHVPGLPDVEVINGVTVHREANSGRYKTPRIKALRRNWSDIARYSAGIRRVAARGDHDFYLLNEWPLMHVLALPGKVRPRTALHWCEIRDDRLLRTLQAQFPKLVGSNFAVGEAVAAAITAQSGRECGVLPSGIEAGRYRAAPGAERSGVLYVGRLAPHKNLPLLIDAFGLAAGRGLVGDLVIAGAGPSLDDVKATVRQSPAADRIRVLGSVDEERKLDLLATSSVLAMPSKREGFPRVIAEAMASGLPVVTAEFPENGGKDVVKQYGAGVVCGTAPIAFADALIDAQAGWEGYSQAGRAGAVDLDWTHIAEKLEKHAEMNRHGG
ncbi:glycosyltransferase family 4 protein [Mycolicibacterium sp. 018/SC-01/001]|uniref:glycosyltransferase family 4 protein n=1 Tax=Mycolicibacterium sp. 018/SC-01/001 TaxID=2592069 RepID=UPI00117D228A|nr:glycosyltransferase family 4 protein [Mycolicibacterium sp. 018/SC-01/001]TRW80450.1 glycosyltransferase family 4 protein [Mycolicibacterium sp. 018/SC-01/001]